MSAELREPRGEESKALRLAPGHGRSRAWAHDQPMAIEHGTDPPSVDSPLAPRAPTTGRPDQRGAPSSSPSAAVLQGTHRLRRTTPRSVTTTIYSASKYVIDAVLRFAGD